MAILFQLVGLAGSVSGLYGFYSSQTALMFIGLAAAVLFCKCNMSSMVEHIGYRILMFPCLASRHADLPFCCKNDLRSGFLNCYLWVLAIVALIFLFVGIREHKESA